MESRSEKFSSNTSRMSKNKELYDDLYKDTNYSNMVVIDDSNEIDISKIKKIIDKEKRPTREINNNYMYDSLKEYYNIQNEEENKKIYDINQVLKDAKNKRNIIEEANEKRKIENYKFKTNLDLENELAKTRKVYNDLVKEETELLTIMNTLTNIDLNNEEALGNTNAMALDMLEDLKDDSPKTKVVKQEQIKPTIKQVTEDDIDDESTEYSTNTFMFETKDFEGLRSVRDQIKKSNVFTKVFIFIFTIAVIVCCYFIITKYLLK